jgi:DNA integrity scanning protein DisA with diadenylate cyclase activity
MKVEWTRAQVDEIEHNAYTVGILTGERMERSRMEKILEAGEENRQADIQLGRHLERERILSLVEDYAENETWSWNDLLRKIKGEN